MIFVPFSDRIFIVPFSWATNETTKRNPILLIFFISKFLANPEPLSLIVKNILEPFLCNVKSMIPSYILLKAYFIAFDMSLTRIIPITEALSGEIKIFSTDFVTVMFCETLIIDSMI